MVSEFRICPNCGAGVVGNTPNCPRCDHPLAGVEAAPTVTSASLQADLAAEPPIEDGDTLQPITPLKLEAAAPEGDLPPTEPDLTIDPLEAEAQEIRLPIEVKTTAQPEVQAAEVKEDFENAQTAPVDPAMIGASGASAPPPADDTQQSSRPAVSAPYPSIPPAPYTAPPLREPTVSVAPYSFPSNYYLEQRMIAYRHGGYELVNYSPYQVTMMIGKPLSFFWWLLAMLSGIGLVWYFLILLSSGFSKDRVFLIVERDGTLYEDGAGAAHVRRRRSRVGRRWGFLGAVIFFISLLWFIGMVVAAIWGVQRYRAELAAAYPTISLFAPSDSAPEPDPDAVSTAESAVLAFSILSVLAIVCLLTGLCLTIVGYLHGAAYDVQVPPLPM